MAQETMERRVQNIEHRLTTVEQILPTLATKADLSAAVAPLPTRQEMRAEIQAAVAPLASRAELEAAVARLATKAELQAAIAPLPTRTEMRAEIQVAVQAEGVETRRHFDVVAEGMHADIRMLAEGIVSTQARCDTRHHDVAGTLTQHDRRLTRMEAVSSKRR